MFRRSKGPPRAILGEGSGAVGVPRRLPPRSVLVTVRQYRAHMAEGGHNGSHGTRVQPAKDWATVLNESWPPPEIARRLRDVDVDKQIPVIAHVVFESGEEQLFGYATRWAKDLPHVRVSINDARLTTGGLWLAPADIQRA